MAAVSTSGSLAGGLSRFASKCGGHREQSVASSIALSQVGGTPLAASSPRHSLSARSAPNKSLPFEKIVCKNSSATQTAVSSSVSGTFCLLTLPTIFLWFASRLPSGANTRHVRLSCIGSTWEWSGLLTFYVMTCGCFLARVSEVSAFTFRQIVFSPSRPEQ